MKHGPVLSEALSAGFREHGIIDQLLAPDCPPTANDEALVRRLIEKQAPGALAAIRQVRQKEMALQAGHDVSDAEYKRRSRLQYQVLMRWARKLVDDYVRRLSPLTPPVLSAAISDRHQDPCRKTTSGKS